MKNRISSKALTIRYGIQQLFYFSIVAGISGFAVTYLSEKGFSTSQTGLLLSVSNLLSCILQPVVGDLVDRLKNFVLPQIITMIYVAVFGCLAIIQFRNPSIGIFGLLYGSAILLTSISSSLSSSLCAFYTNRGHSVNYGVGAGVGSMAFSFASLGFGYVMAWFGVEWMVWLVLGMCIIQWIIILGYPKVAGEETEVTHSSVEYEERVSIFRFFIKYKGFMFTLLGVMLLAMCHVMSENYFIKIFEAIGGGSENVGTALFIACISAAPFLLLFEKVQEKVDIYRIMCSAGVFFALKMLLLIFATQIWQIYLIQLLQTVTYCFTNPPLYYMAKRRISEADLVKGQTVAAAMYTLGTSSGNLVGGRMIDNFGVTSMLWMAFAAAVAGAIIIWISLRKEFDTGK